MVSDRDTPNSRSVHASLLKCVSIDEDLVFWLGFDLAHEQETKTKAVIMSHDRQVVKHKHLS
jgi:hypothetical protein